jgi:hypothetical protein
LVQGTLWANDKLHFWEVDESGGGCCWGQSESNNVGWYLYLFSWSSLLVHGNAQVLVGKEERINSSSFSWQFLQRAVYTLEDSLILRVDLK